MQVRYATTAGRWVLAATVLGSGMASIDATVVGIALPSIGRDLHTSLSELQWVVSGYLLTLCALLLPGGALGDQSGRRRVFNLGVVWFTIASAGCAVAPDAIVLILLRVLQGVGAAFLTPGSLAIIEASFDKDSRAQAIGAWSGLGGVATAVGPLLGGYLIAAASWRWIFVINLPLGVAVLWISSRRVPESRDPDAPSRIDIPGAVLATLALVGVTYGLIQGPASGWTQPDVVILLLLGAASGVAFYFVERSAAHPMLPLSLLKVRQFTVTNAVTFIIYGALSGALFLFPVSLQVVNHYSPLESGVALLPLTVIMLLFSARSGKMASRIGPRLQMSVGPLVVAAGLALLARSTTDGWYPTGVLPAVLVFGVGLAITVAPLTSTAMNSLAEEHAGIASALNNDVARTGGLIAVAILPAIAGLKGNAYLHAGAVASGFRTATAVSAAFCALGGVVAAIGIENRIPTQPMDEGLYCALDATPQASRR
ncbi:MAG TPA: DHA2 family efflux MFS transporter permease subunit [Acidimicrobiales bacterium]